MTDNIASKMIAIFGCLVLGAAAHAQATSTFTVQASGTVTTAPEAVTFSGPIEVASTMVTDPAGGPAISVVNIDTRGLSAQGASSGALFINSGQARLTRPLVGTDVIQTTFSFFPTGPGGFLKPRTAVATLNLTYNLATGALTGVTASISTPNFP